MYCRCTDFFQILIKFFLKCCRKNVCMCVHINFLQQQGGTDWEWCTQTKMSQKMSTPQPNMSEWENEWEREGGHKEVKTQKEADRQLGTDGRGGGNATQKTERGVLRTSKQVCIREASLHKHIGLCVTRVVPFKEHVLRCPLQAWVISVPFMLTAFQVTVSHL